MFSSNQAIADGYDKFHNRRLYSALSLPAGTYHLLLPFRKQGLGIEIIASCNQQRAILTRRVKIERRLVDVSDPNTQGGHEQKSDDEQPPVANQIGNRSEFGSCL